MNVGKMISFVFTIFFGIFMFVYGEIDDSPGAQGLGLLAFIFGVVSMVKAIRKTSISKRS